MKYQSLQAKLKNPANSSLIFAAAETLIVKFLGGGHPLASSQLDFTDTFPANFPKKLPKHWAQDHF